MKRLFNNPLVIVALACFAAYIVYSNAIQPYLSDTASETNKLDIPVFEESIGIEENTKTTIRALTKVNTRVLFWNETPKRDPFSPIPTITKEEINEAKKIRKQSEKRAKKEIIKKEKKHTTKKIKKYKVKKLIEPLPILMGFISGEASKRAILNGQIVSEGQRFKSFQVITIKNDGVIIKRIGDGAEHMLSAAQ